MLKFLSEVSELMNKPYYRLSFAERHQIGFAVVMFFIVLNLVIFGIAEVAGVFDKM